MSGNGNNTGNGQGQAGPQPTLDWDGLKRDYPREFEVAQKISNDNDRLRAEQAQAKTVQADLERLKRDVAKHGDHQQEINRLRDQLAHTQWELEQQRLNHQINYALAEQVKDLKEENENLRRAAQERDQIHHHFESLQVLLVKHLSLEQDTGKGLPKPDLSALRAREDSQYHDFFSIGDSQISQEIPDAPQKPFKTQSREVRSIRQPDFGEEQGFTVGAVRPKRSGMSNANGAWKQFQKK